MTKDLFSFQTIPPSQTPLTQLTVWTPPSEQFSQQDQQSQSNLSSQIKKVFSCTPPKNQKLCSFTLLFYPTDLEALILVKPMYNDAFFHLTRSHYHALINPFVPYSPSPLSPSPLGLPIQNP